MLFLVFDRVSQTDLLIHTHIHTYMHTYIHIYRDRESERESRKSIDLLKRL